MLSLGCLCITIESDNILTKRGSTIMGFMCIFVEDLSRSRPRKT